MDSPSGEVKVYPFMSTAFIGGQGVIPHFVSSIFSYAMGAIVGLGPLGEGLEPISPAGSEVEPLVKLPDGAAVVEADDPVLEGTGEVTTDGCIGVVVTKSGDAVVAGIAVENDSPSAASGGVAVVSGRSPSKGIVVENGEAVEILLLVASVAFACVDSAIGSAVAADPL
jgi:hypothetical protein